MNDQPNAAGKFTGLALDLPHAGRVHLAHLFARTTETELYFTDCPGIVVKVFDLGCTQSDEISYGPYLGFKLELANYEDINKTPSLAALVPVYHGAHIDYEQKYACIAMGFLDGQDLKSWCEQGVAPGQEDAWVLEFRRIVYETLAIIRVFHAHHIILLDLKPENVLRLKDGTIRLVDLGAFFTPRHTRDVSSYLYCATPEHAEVLIDVSNLQTGLPPTEVSDVFSAGVALFEMATGTSRLVIDDGTAQDILDAPELYRFLDSQIRDVWHGFPHLRNLLPLVQSQLADRHLLFSELWHLLKAYIGRKVPDWESLSAAQQDQILLATGTTFIVEQLPPQLLWLCSPIAQATALRGVRLKSITDLMGQIADPIQEEIRQDIEQHNCYVQYLHALDISTEWIDHLNSWEVRREDGSGHWAVTAVVASRPLLDSAQYVFLRQSHAEPGGHRFFHVVDELEADRIEEGRLTLGHLTTDRLAWLGLPLPA